MEHADAVKLQAVEKYILGELSPPLRDEFEAHYFDCPECSLNVRTGVAFAAGSKEYFKEPAVREIAPPARERDWFRWLTPRLVIPVFAALLFVIGYQNTISIPRLKQTAASSAGVIGPWFSLVNSDVRGPAGQKFEVLPGHSFLLFIPITARLHGPESHFLVRLEDSSGKNIVSSTVSGIEAKKPVPFSVPPLSREGEYRVVILEETAGSATQVSEFPFAVAFSSHLKQH
jgi:hypothetical protein